MAATPAPLGANYFHLSQVCLKHTHTHMYRVLPLSEHVLAICSSDRVIFGIQELFMGNRGNNIVVQSG